MVMDIEDRKAGLGTSIVLVISMAPAEPALWKRGNQFSSKWNQRPSEDLRGEAPSVFPACAGPTSWRQQTMSEKLHPGFFYGTTERRYDLEGLTLAETVYPAGLVIPPHEHSNAFFCLLLEGHCTQSCDRRTSTGGPLTLTCLSLRLGSRQPLARYGGPSPSCRIRSAVAQAPPWTNSGPGPSSRLRGRPAGLARQATRRGVPASG